jgi:hypothetical protein
LSCQRDEDLVIGEGFLEDNSYALVIDTISFRTSTILMDSIKSSGEFVMAGKMYDEQFGHINVNSFFQIGPPESVKLGVLDESATYDSIFLELIYNGYNYGDTMQYQTLEVYSLLEDIVANEDDGYLYNTSSFAIQPGCLGRISYRPNPRSGETESIRLSDEFGRELFALIKEEDDILTDREDFLDRFKGLMLTAGDMDGSCIIGFIAAEESEYDIETDQGEMTEPTEEQRVLLRLYYHDKIPGSEEKEIEWELINEDLQFNQILIDRTGTLVDTALVGDQRLKSQYTDDLTFIQGGQPIMSCIEIPYIDNLRLTGNNGMLIYAGLHAQPLKGSYDDPYRLPSTLNVWICNDDNEFLEPLYDDLGDTVRSTLYIDHEFDENTFYEIPVTSFLQYELDNDLITDYSLILTLPTSQMGYSLERLVLGGNNHQDHAMRLELYYLFY